MKKKLLTLMTLLLAVCNGAWAQTTLISYTVNETTSATEANSGEWVDRTPTGTPGGTVSFYLKWDWDSKNNKMSSAKGYFISSSKGYYLGGNVAAVKLTLSGEETFQEGDIVRVTYSSGSASENRQFTVRNAFSDKGTFDGEVLSTGTISETTEDITLTSAFTGKGIIYVQRYNSKTINIKVVTVIRPATKTQWDAPTISYEYNGSTEKYDITLSGETGATLSYKIGAEGSEETYSTSFAVNPSVTVYAKASGEPYTASDWASLVIPAKPSVEIPVYNVGSYDYTHSGYPVTITCDTDGATLEYITTTSTEEGSTLDWSGATTYDGTPFYLTNTRVAIRATKTGYTTSYDNKGVRVYVNNAPSTTSPETLIPITKGDKGKDVTHVYKSVTVQSAAMAGGSADGNYLKMRTNQNSNTATITVNEGYVVTGFSISAYSNNTGATIGLSDIKFNGTTPDGFTTVTLPVTAATQTYGEYENTGLNLSAGQTIVMTFDNSAIDGTDGKKNCQILASIEVAYKLASTLALESESANIYIGDNTTITASAHDGTVTFVSKNTDIATVTDGGVVTGVAAGTTTITVSDPGDATHAAGTKTFTVTVSEFALTGKFKSSATDGYTTLALDERENKTNSVSNSKITISVLNVGGSVQVRNNKINKKSGENYNGITISAATGYAITEIAFSVSSSEKGYTLSPSATYTDGTTHTFNNATSVILTNETNNNIELSEIIVTFAPTLTIGSYSWASYSNQDYAIDLSSLPSGITAAYAVTAVGSETVKLTPITEAVEAGTGILLNGTTGTYALTAASSGSDISSTNKLIATPAGGFAITSGTYYILYQGAMHPATEGTIPTFKAYLPSDGISTARALSFVFDDGETTGINEAVRNQNGITPSMQWYNLSGQRVSNPTKGMYIVNGKKVIIK